MPTALFICAIRVEWQAIIARFDNAVEIADDQNFYCQGTVEIDGVLWNAAVAEAGVGNVEAALSTSEAIPFFQPDIVIFVGIAGGVKDVALGDVVAATRVHMYESGKDHELALTPRARSSDFSYRTQQIGKALARDTAPLVAYRIICAPIAAGEKVVASQASATANLIRSSYGDTVAVEMEGAGFAVAMKRHPKVEFALIRGISDLLDAKTQSDGAGWQERASENAMDVALRFLTKYSQVTPTPPATPANVFSGRTAPQPAKRNMSPLGSQLKEGLPTPNSTQVYVLVTLGCSTIAQSIISSGVPLNVVLDLDTETDTTGLHTATHAALAQEKMVKLRTLEDPLEPSLTAITWLAVRGLEGRQNVSRDSRSWIRSARRIFRGKLEELAATFGGRHTNFLIATDDDKGEEWLRLVIEDILSVFEDTATLSAVGPSVPEELGALVDAEFLIPSGQASSAFTEWVNLWSVPHDGQFELPGAHGTLPVDNKDRAWLSEDLTPVWLGAGNGNAEVERLSFLRGGEIGWAAVAADADVRRTLQPELEKRVTTALAKRHATRINLYHEPGAGGSVLARRLAFSFHANFPVAEVRVSREGETVRRIDWMARKTELPVLVIVDGADLSDRMVGDLIRDLRAGSIPATLLHVSRRFNAPSDLSSSLYLRSILDSSEANAFYETYAKQTPEATTTLAEVRDMSDERRTPFFFALSAFETDFTGLEKYVENRLSDISETQQRLILFCALAHYYGQQSIPEHQLATLVGLPSSKAASLQLLLNPGVKSLLWRSQTGQWRTVHQLVAREVMRQLGGSPERDWRQHLTGWGKEFIDFCRGESHVVSTEMLEIARAVFVYRGSEDLLGTEGSGRDMFSRLIEDIPSGEGAVDMLSYLASTFPDEAHFSAHVARYYAFRLKNFERATDYADKAVASLPNSAVLWHVVGMVYRARVGADIGLRKTIEAIAEQGEKASLSFERSRELSSNDNVHAFISDAQLKIRIIDYAIRDAGSIAAYLKKNPHPYVVECISGAEDLLAQVRNTSDLRRPNGYEERSTAELTKLYGDYNAALQMFDAILARETSNKVPVRRQLIWTYLARSKRDWSSLPQKRIQRVVSLLEENLREGSYSASDIRQWWRAVRHLDSPPSQDRLLELLAYWREGDFSTEALYCSYIAYTVDVLDGIATALPLARKFQDECAARARGYSDRSWSYEWIGHEQGILMLVHQSELGEWDKEKGFWADPKKLRRVEARVSVIKGPQAGTVEFQGLSAFFVPSIIGFEKGRDENRIISGYIGFSQDGMRMWEPLPADE